MSNYKMNINGEIKLSDYSYIHDYMAIVEPEDNFQIELNNVGAEDTKVLCSILESDKFDIINKNNGNIGQYCIFAVKRQ